MARKWRFAPHDESEVRGMSSRLRISPLLAQVLLSRGFTSENANGFLDAKLVDLLDPERLPGVPEASERIVAAIADKRRITIYGDYDVDGMTSTSLLWHCLKLAGAHVDYYIPSRLYEGYGLNQEAIRQFHAEDPKRLVITVDCGIARVEEAALARELGLELIVTDHHQMAETLPDAACLVHPRLPDTNYPFGDLCGVGVAFKLAWAVCQRLGDGKKASPRMKEFLMGAVGLAAIGTVADVVPLVGENRIIVRYGLNSLAERATPGLEALFKVASLEKNHRFDAEDIAFAIAPRMNAAGRLGQARLAVELLTTENEERAAALAEYLDELNNSRRKLERRIFQQAKELVSENKEWDSQAALVLANRDWHAGVIGIVANRVAEHFQKPTFLISLSSETNMGQGSGRSFGGCNLHAGLTTCAPHLLSFGGHAAAAGLRIDAKDLDSFREDFSQYVEENRDDDHDDLTLQIDAEVRLADVTRKAVFELDRLGPFGQSNPRPLFAATNVELAEPPKKMGEGERHLSLRVRQQRTTFRAIAFGKGQWADEIAKLKHPFCISFAPGINRFRGRENVELQLKDWQPGDQET